MSVLFLRVKYCETGKAHKLPFWEPQCRPVTEQPTVDALWKEARPPQRLETYLRPVSATDQLLDSLLLANTSIKLSCSRFTTAQKRLSQILFHLDRGLGYKL